MSVRKRGGKYQASIGSGTNRQTKTFNKEGDAKNWVAKMRNQIVEGKYVPAARSITMAQLAVLYLDDIQQRVDQGELEPTTAETYQTTVNRHVVPLLGPMKLTDLEPDTIEWFRKRLASGDKPAPGMRQHLNGLMNHRNLPTEEKEAARKLADTFSRGPTVIKKTLNILSQMLSYGILIHRVHRNAVQEMRKLRRRKHSSEDRGQKLEPGKHIPTIEEIKGVLRVLDEAADGERDDIPQWLPLMVLIWTGLRISELRALQWQDIEFKNKRWCIVVKRRADKHQKVDDPKTLSGYLRQIPIGDNLLARLRAYRATSKWNADTDYIFPTDRKGTVQGYNNVKQQGLYPVLLAAGLAEVLTDEDGNVRRLSRGRPRVSCKYARGFHMLRHFYASLMANEGLSPSKLSGRMGHKDVATTMRVYVHLFQSEDTGEEMTALERVMHQISDAPRKVIAYPGKKS